MQFQPHIAGQKLASFDPPCLGDLNPQQAAQWSEIVSYWISQTQQPGKDEPAVPRQNIFNATQVPLEGDFAIADISWSGFPRQVKIGKTDVQRWKEADRYRGKQDEYCEWAVTKGEDGKVRRITFTCEGPEYWSFLGQTSPEKVVELYRQHVSEAVQHEDLFRPDGSYIKANIWNDATRDGKVMHLIMRANSLYAELELAAGSSVVRKREDGTIMTDEQELIKCVGYGARSRNSDPHIGATVNKVVRDSKAFVAISNPVGLFFDKFNPSAAWATPDGTNPVDFWKIVRGTPEKPVRAVLEVPESKGYSLGDVKINGKPIKYGGQVADFVNIKLSAVIHGKGKADFGAFPAPYCGNGPHGAAAGSISIPELAERIRKD